MYRQSFSHPTDGAGGHPPIPTIIDAGCAGFEEGMQGRPRISMLSAQSYSENRTGAARQSRNPDRILAVSASTGGNHANHANNIRNPVPTASLVRTKSSVLVREQLRDLQEMGYPTGLALELGRTRALFPTRFWIIDNSGSMLNNDGHTIRGTASVPCTRWHELQETVIYHAELAAILQATTHFRMLNNPGVRVGPQEFSIADKDKSPREEILAAKKIMQNARPNGATPLTDHLIEIGERIRELEDYMRQKGLEAVIIIATDGLPTSADGVSSDQVNNEFITALSRLQMLPVWIVIRLCTDEQAVVDFYNTLDSTLELPLEVLDDHLNEAKECHQYNGWLNYALPLHRCREIGYHHRIFDLLDERPLNKDEVKEFCSVLLGSEYFKNCPDVHTDWNGFLKLVSNVVKEEQHHFNPLTQKVAPWIDVAHMKKSFGGGGVLGIFKRHSVRK